MNTMTLGFTRAGLEIKQFSRRKEALIFTLAFPVVILILLGSIFSSEHAGIKMSQMFAGGMIATAVLSTAFVGFVVDFVTDRESGGLKRLRGTPLPPASYFIGKLLMVGVTTTIAVGVMLAVGVVMFDLQLPDASGWLTFAWLFVLSVVCCTLLGITFSTFIRSARSAGAMVSLPVYALQFISGVFVAPITALPALMVGIASFFPLKWMAQGFRSVFLPDRAVAFEMAGSWELGRVALVLGAWCVAGLVLCLMTFRWTPRGER